jgi:hypothetical protein
VRAGQGRAGVIDEEMIDGGRFSVTISEEGLRIAAAGKARRAQKQEVGAEGGNRERGEGEG